VCNEGITQFYLSPTHEPHLPFFPSRKASPPFGAYPRRDGQVELTWVTGHDYVSVEALALTCGMSHNGQWQV